MTASTPCSPGSPTLPTTEKLSSPNPGLNDLGLNDLGLNDLGLNDQGLNDGRAKAMSSSASQATLFSLLPETRKPWTEFVFSTGLQAAAVALLVWVRLLYPQVVAAPEHTFRSVELVSTPVPVNH